MTRLMRSVQINPQVLRYTLRCQTKDRRYSLGHLSRTLMMTWFEFVRLILVTDKSRSAKRSDEAISLEQLAKFLTAASAVCFTIGVVCTSIYFASVSLRPFDPISVQQIFLGVLFLAMVVLTLVIPARSGTRAVAGWSIQIATVLCLVFDDVFTNQLAYVLSRYY